MKSEELYHVTNKTNSDNILKKKSFERIIIPPIYKLSLPQQNFRGRRPKKPGTLGFGLYAFENDESLAESFGERMMSDYRVISFKISCPDDVFFDFNDSDDIEVFHAFLKGKEVKHVLKVFKKNFNNHGPQKELQGALVEFFISQMVSKKLYSSIKCVRITTATAEGELVDVMNGIEVCIRSTSIIDDTSICLAMKEDE